jgi:hypothetical protein
MDGINPNTTWFRFISFPLFILNAIQNLGNVREGSGDELAEPGEPITLHPETQGKTITVAPLGGGTLETITRSPQGSFVFSRAGTSGVYVAHWENDGQLPFAVNLFDTRESNLASRGIVPEGAPDAMAESFKIKIGASPVAGTQKAPIVRKDIWWYFALLVLGILLVEWYVYNRRVFI